MSYSCADVCDRAWFQMCSGCSERDGCHPAILAHDDKRMARCLANLPVDITGPWPREEEWPRVVIEVQGGVAEITQLPPGIEVEIIDHDNEEA